jgi:hypothetical protein
MDPPPGRLRRWALGSYPTRVGVGSVVLAIAVLVVSYYLAVQLGSGEVHCAPCGPNGTCPLYCWTQGSPNQSIAGGLFVAGIALLGGGISLAVGAAIYRARRPEPLP